MAVRIENPKSLYIEFKDWANRQNEDILTPYNSLDHEMPTQSDQMVPQTVIFRDDLKRHIHNLSTHTQYHLFSLTQSIVALVASPFFALGEIYRFCSQETLFRTSLNNIFEIPKEMLFANCALGLKALNSLNAIVSASSIGIGFLTWHGGEKLIHLLSESKDTVLSNSSQVRDIVAESFGLTLLALGGIFIPIPPIQMAALPIIFGSIYGTLNNQFTVRECPEYYTMGHYYDGTHLRGHAIKSNNVLIKPIVTGCYATTFVTKLAGIILSAAATAPYTATALPVPLAATMIGGITVVALVAAHIFSTMKKNSIEKNLAEYGDLIGLEWNEENKNKRWLDLEVLRAQHIENKRRELGANAQKLKFFNQRLDELTEAIEQNILNPLLPVKYIVGWQANNTRNSVGYLFAGGGTLAITIMTLYLRIFVL